MGKKGAALRAERAASARYSFTGAELEAYARYKRYYLEEEK